MADKPAQGVPAEPLRLPPAQGRPWSTADRDETADVVIVGAGAGGSAAARVLTRAGKRVVLVEEGPSRRRYERHFGPAMRHHQQEGGAIVALSDAPIPIAAGRGLGGGTIINSAIAWRTPDEVLDGWSELLGSDIYSPANMRPVYDMLWATLGIWTTRLEIAGENNLLIARGAQALGYEGGLLERATPGCVGCGVCYYGCPTGGKASMDTNLLADAVLHGLVVQAETKVDGILVEGDRAVGVTGQMVDPETGSHGGRYTCRAPEVMVACGGIGTPRLLHHAGLADRLGPAVGKGLHLHPGNAVLGWCDHDINLWHGATQGAYFHPPDLPGVLPHSFSAPPEAVLGMLHLTGQDSKAMLPRLPKLCGAVVMISDKGHGSVGAFSDGRARVSYAFDPSDVERIKAGMYHTGRVLLAGGAKTLFAPVHGTGTYDSAEALRHAITPLPLRDFVLYASHPMSSCRMGLDPKTSVCGPTGRCHGLRGLTLCDSSIFPTSLGVNPSLTVMAMAMRIAEHLAVSL